MHNFGTDGAPYADTDNRCNTTSDTAYDEGMHLNFSDIAVDLYENPQILKVRIKDQKPIHFVWV